MIPHGYPGKLKVICTARIHPTESEARVESAVRQILPRQNKHYLKDGLLSSESADPDALEQIYGGIRERMTVAAARKLLIRNAQSTQTFLLLNRQAAYVGTVALCDSPDESPLGPLELRIESDDIKKLVDWLAPETPRKPTRGRALRT